MNKRDQRQPAGFPSVQGLKGDLSNQDVARHIANNSVSIKGIKFTSKVGTTSDIVIDISGTAKFLLGFKFVYLHQLTTFDPNVQFSININNEQVVQDAFVDLHDGASNYDGEYTPLPRMLSGKDTIRLSFTDVVSQDVGIEFYYI